MIDDIIKQIRRDPIEALDQHIRQLGFGAQRDAFMTSVLAEISPAAGFPFSILLAGNPASGKSTVASKTARLVGPSFVVSTSGLNRMTAAAASRMASRLTHHCVVCDERAQNNEFDGLWRQALSDQPASRIITFKGDAVELTIQPPISSVEAVLSEKELTAQDRSRYLRLKMREDETALSEIRCLSRLNATLEGRRRQEQFDLLCRAYQMVLCSHRRDLFVDVPFAAQIALRNDASFAVRTEKHILRVIQAVAWFRQGSRSIEQDSSEGQFIRATVDDYRIIHPVLLRSCEDGAIDMSDNAAALFRKWKAWTAEQGNSGVNRVRFNEITGNTLSGCQIYRALRELHDIDLAEGPTGRGMRGLWRLSDLGMATDRPNSFLSLPKPEEIEIETSSRQIANLTSA